MSTDRKPTASGYPFPSRKDIHGSRIPKAQGASTAEPVAPPSGSLRESLAGEARVPRARPLLASQETASQDQEEVGAGEAQTPDSGKHAEPAGPRGVSEPQPSEHEEPAGPQGASERKLPSRRESATRTGSLKLPAETGPEATAEPKPESEPKPRASAPKQALPSRRVTRSGATNGAITSGVLDSKQSEALASSAAQKAKRRRRRKRLRTTLILIILVGLVGTAVWFAVRSLNPTEAVVESDDYPGPGTGSTEVTVDVGDHGADIAQKLYAADVVKSPEAFIRAFDNSAAAETIKPGTYTLKLQMSAAGALAAILDETNRQDNAFTVNAGQTVAQVKDKLEQVAGYDLEEIDAAFADPGSIGLPEVADGNAEGWLAAGAYEIAPGEPVSSVLQQMVAKQVQNLEELGVPEDQWEVVLTKASILEREASLEEDLPKVARVIANRIENPEAETQGLLQMDSTVLYGVGKSGGIPTLEELETDTPYNTYLHAGLPPGPIATPSTAAIAATLEPAEGNWLYFVTVNLDTGETLFTDSLDEQEANIRLLTEWCKANPGRC